MKLLKKMQKNHQAQENKKSYGLWFICFKNCSLEILFKSRMFNYIHLDCTTSTEKKREQYKECALNY